MGLGEVIMYTVAEMRKKQEELLYNIHKQNLEKVYSLLEEGIDPSFTTEGGYTPLHMAALNCHRSNFYYEVAEYLLLFGANPNLTNNNHETPLFLASYRDSLSMVTLLLNNNADPNVITKGGYIALQLAKSQKVKDLLLKYGANFQVLVPKVINNSQVKSEHPNVRKRDIFDLSAYEQKFYPVTYQFEEKYLQSTITLVRKKLGYLEILEESNRVTKDWSAHVLSRHFSSGVSLLKSMVSRPYFGRIDIERNGKKETLYIGENGLDNNDDGRIWVINWATPIAELFYKKTLGKGKSERLGLYNVQLIRTFDITEGSIRNIHDQTAGIGYGDTFLQSALSQKKASSSMDNIVSTIQAEQDDIIRISKNRPLIVQGSAGSGKTTVALHRLAYLFYNNSDIEPEQMIIFGPNKLFIKYIENVLPGLGVNGIQQSSFEEWALSVLSSKESNVNLTSIGYFIEMHDNDPNNYQRMRKCKIKGSLKWKSLLEEYLKSFEERIILPKVISISLNEENKFEIYDIREKFFKEYSYLPLLKRWGKLEQVIIKNYHDFVRRIIDPYEKELSNIMDQTLQKRKKEQFKIDKASFISNFSNLLNQIKSQFSNISVLQLYRDFILKSEISQFGEITKEELITEDDLPALLTVFNYLYGYLSSDDKESRYKYVVIDEAQDWNPFQLSIIYQHLCFDNSIMLLGDLGQSIFEGKGIDRWSEITGLFRQKPTYIELSTSYRSTIPITTFANNILSSYSKEKEFGISKPVLREGNEPFIQGFTTNKEIIFNIHETIRKCSHKDYKNVAILTKTAEQAKVVHEHLQDQEIKLIINSNNVYEGGSVVLPVYLSKGLEFDVVIVCNATDYNYPDNEQNRKLLYVATTRALHELYLFYKGSCSPIIEKS